MKPKGNSGKGINDSANKLQRATQNNDSKKIEKHLGRAENSTDQIFDKNSRRLEKKFSKIDRDTLKNLPPISKNH